MFVALNEYQWCLVSKYCKHNLSVSVETMVSQNILFLLRFPSSENSDINKNGMPWSDQDPQWFHFWPRTLTGKQSRGWIDNGESNTNKDKETS